MEFARHAEFALVAKYLLGGSAAGGLLQASVTAEAERAPERVRDILKAAVASGSTSDVNWAGALAPYRLVQASFIETLRTQSVFYRLLSGGMLRVPLRTQLTLLSSTAGSQPVGHIVSERSWKPVSSVKFANAAVDALKAAGLVVVSQDVLRFAGDGAVNLLNNELRRCVAAAVDAEFLSVITAGAPSAVATADPYADLRGLLQIVNVPGASNSLFWVMSPDTANMASTSESGTPGLDFPGMGPTGGEMLNLPGLVSDQVASGVLLLVDAGGIAGDSDVITLNRSTSADVQMVDNPGAGASNLVSLFQTNSAALLVETYFGAEKFRSNAVAQITGVAWT